MGLLSPAENLSAQAGLDELRRSWREMQPSEALREQAESLLHRFPLKAADSLQLAAALAWCLGRAKGRVFISGDSQLLDAARHLGFSAIES
jgi:hypothetical protein